VRPAIDRRAQTRAIGRQRQHLHHAAKRVSAVEIASRAADDLHTVDRRRRHPVPVDPAAKRIVERHTVRQYQRTAGAGARHTAQRHALRRRVRHARGRSAEQREPGCLSQGIIERASGGVGELGRCHHGAARRAWQALDATAGGNHNRVREAHGPKHDAQRTGRRRDGHHDFREAVGADPQPIGRAVELETAVGPDRKGRFSPIRRDGDHPGFGHGGAGDVHDHPARRSLPGVRRRRAHQETQKGKPFHDYLY
jgi:hypothetical protein